MPFFSMKASLAVSHDFHRLAGPTYGAAASIVVLLIWVYYVAQIVLLGAEFTKRVFQTAL